MPVKAGILCFRRFLDSVSSPECQKRKLHVAILHSSEMGFRIYERMGFRQLCDFYIFANATENVEDKDV
jgi:hypothetical protein